MNPVEYTFSGTVPIAKTVFAVPNAAKESLPFKFFSNPQGAEGFPGLTEFITSLSGRNIIKGQCGWMLNSNGNRLWAFPNNAWDYEIDDSSKWDNINDSGVDWTFAPGYAQCIIPAGSKSNVLHYIGNINAVQLARTLTYNWQNNNTLAAAAGLSLSLIDQGINDTVKGPVLLNNTNLACTANTPLNQTGTINPTFLKLGSIGFQVTNGTAASQTFRINTFSFNVFVNQSDYSILIDRIGFCTTDFDVDNFICLDNGLVNKVFRTDKTYQLAANGRIILDGQASAVTAGAVVGAIVGMQIRLSVE